MLINNWSHASYHDDIFILLCVDIENIIMDDSINDNNFASIKVIALKNLIKHQCIKIDQRSMYHLVTKKNI